MRVNNALAPLYAFIRKYHVQPTADDVNAVYCYRVTGYIPDGFPSWIPELSKALMNCGFENKTGGDIYAD